MQIQKLIMCFYNPETKDIEEKTTYRISYKSLMVTEEDLGYAFRKMIMYATYKKLLVLR